MIYTAQRTYKGHDIIDVGLETTNLIGKWFVPERIDVINFINGKINSEEFEKAYHTTLNNRYVTNEAMQEVCDYLICMGKSSSDHITLVCDDYHSKFCHKMPLICWLQECFGPGLLFSRREQTQRECPKCKQPLLWNGKMFVCTTFWCSFVDKANSYIYKARTAVQYSDPWLSTPVL